jgi:hypothetical protein
VGLLVGGLLLLVVIVIRTSRGDPDLADAVIRLVVRYLVSVALETAFLREVTVVEGLVSAWLLGRVDLVLLLVDRGTGEAVVVVGSRLQRGAAG